MKGVWLRNLHFLANAFVFTVSDIQITDYVNAINLTTCQHVISMHPLTTPSHQPMLGIVYIYTHT